MQTQEQIAKAYAEPMRVVSYEVDAFGRMTAGALLRRAQQVATDQCDLLGLTLEAHKRAHTAFLLAKMTLECYAPIGENARLTLTTVPTDLERAVFRRYTRFEDEGGALLAAVDSRWVLVDVQTRRILRRMPDTLPHPFCTQPVPELELAIQKAEAVQPLGTQRAVYSHCDRNGHLNNTVYADVVCDALGAERLRAGGVKRFAITYHSEVPQEQSFALCAAPLDEAEKRWYFLGAGDDAKKHFEADVALF